MAMAFEDLLAGIGQAVAKANRITEITSLSSYIESGYDISRSVGDYLNTMNASVNRPAADPYDERAHRGSRRDDKAGNATATGQDADMSRRTGKKRKDHEAMTASGLYAPRRRILTGRVRRKHRDMTASMMIVSYPRC